MNGRRLARCAVQLCVALAMSPAGTAAQTPSDQFRQVESTVSDAVLRQPVDGGVDRAAFDSALAASWTASKSGEPSALAYYGRVLLAGEERHLVPKDLPGQRVGMRFYSDGIVALAAAAEASNWRGAYVSLFARALLPPARFRDRTTVRLAHEALDSMRAMRPVPDDTAALYWWGRLEERFGAADSAAGAYCRAATLVRERAEYRARCARVMLASGDTAGVTGYYEAASRRNAEVTRLLTDDLQYLLSGDSVDAIREAMRAGNLAPLRRVWSTRDRASMRPDGARLAEHYRRLFYADQRYRLDRWPRRYATFERVHLPDAQMDDRGVMYVRHGKPDTTVSAAGISACYNTSWLYQRPAGNLVLHFSGRTDPYDWRLLETLFDVGSMDFPSGDTGDCGAPPELPLSRRVMDPIYAKLQFSQRPRDLLREKQLVQRSLKVATSTDDFVRRYGHAAQAIVQFYGLFGAAGRGAVLVAAAVQPKEWPVDTSGAGRVLTIDTELWLTRLDAATRWHVDSTRRLVLPSAMPRDGHLALVQESDAAPGRYTLGYVLADSARRVGQFVRLPELEVPSAEARGATVSDIVLGRPGSGVEWMSPAGRFPLNPLNAYTRADTVEIYYEVAGVPVGADYGTTVAVVDASRKRRGVSLTLSERARSSIVRQRRLLSLERLRPGDYLLSVTITSRGERTESEVQLHVKRGP